MRGKQAKRDEGKGESDGGEEPKGQRREEWKKREQQKEGGIWNLEYWFLGRIKQIYGAIYTYIMDDLLECRNYNQMLM